MKAPPETLAYVAMLSATGNGVPDASRGRRYRSVTRRDYGTESAASISRIPAMSCITSAGTPAVRRSVPYAPHPHVERRYLVVPGLRSSRIHIIDTKADPRNRRS